MKPPDEVRIGSAKNREGKRAFLALCVEETGGYVKGVRLAAYVIGWGIARDDLGHPPGAQEYGEYWKQPRRSAFEEQARFREVFGDRFDSPADLLALMERQGLGEVVRLDRLATAGGRGAEG